MDPNLLKVLDYISVSNLCIVAYPFIDYLLTGSSMSAVLAIAITICHIVTVALKFITSKYFVHPMFLRPAHARNCDYMCRNGLVGGKPGFPSGHMSSTLAFFTVILLYKFHYGSRSIRSNDVITVACIAGAYSLVMGYARHLKGCHTMTQIVVGSVLGIFIGWIVFLSLNS